MVIERNRTRSRLLALVTGLGAAGLTYAALSLGAPEKPGRNNLQVYLITGAFFMSVGCLLFAIRSVQKGPGLYSTSQGIHIPVSFQMPGPIPWEQITGFELATVGIAKVIRVKVSDPEKLIAGTSGIKAWLNRNNLRNGGTPVIIPCGALNLQPIEIFRLLQHSLETWHNDRKAPASEPQIPGEA